MISHKHGEKILFSDGEYSDYGTGPMIQVLRDLDIGELAQAYQDQAPINEYDNERRVVDNSAFAAWLVSQGWAEEIDYDEVHTGSYGQFEIEEMKRSAAERALTSQ